MKTSARWNGAQSINCSTKQSGTSCAAAGPKERSLEANLERLRAYRERDPQFRRARKAFVEAEASVDDPLEGEPVEGQLVNGQIKPIGPAQSKIRDILGA